MYEAERAHLVPCCRTICPCFDFDHPLKCSGVLVGESHIKNCTNYEPLPEQNSIREEMETAKSIAHRLHEAEIEILKAQSEGWCQKAESMLQSAAHEVAKHIQQGLLGMEGGEE